MAKQKVPGLARSKSRAVATERTASATLRHVRISPRKLRLVINMVKGRQLSEAESVLKMSPTKGGKILLKLLDSAKHNAKEAKGLDIDRLWVTAGWVDMGRTLKRFMPRAQGRATPIRKRSAHVTVVVGERA